ncbi:hypothetical protein [Rhodococcus sp. SMB37]|uniref:hypothetical protein n=1 Tax=Rhodococcus sp. SMB37 TaxID=2512213 RepID=UPI001F5419A1|nr:hypothetical protein [Rhodococcus sp. SMB37]
MVYILEGSVTVTTDDGHTITLSPRRRGDIPGRVVECVDGSDMSTSRTAHSARAPVFVGNGSRA